MEKHFVTFCSPGTFVSETSLISSANKIYFAGSMRGGRAACTREIAAWNVDEAVAMSREIKERHGATPYGFYFTTRTRGEADFDSKQTAKSNFYWLGGDVRTADEVLAGTDPKEQILRDNVRINDFKRIITNRNSWKFTSQMEDDDVVLSV